MNHDVLCACSEGPCCPWLSHCECQCMCEFIAQVRTDELYTVVRMIQDNKRRARERRWYRRAWNWARGLL